MDKNKWVYVGIGAFFLLILFNSTKNVQLKSVEVPNTNNSTGQKSFDSSRLPVFLKPPSKLTEGESLPKLNVPKRVLGFTMTPKPRFDI
jgi:hypothetical protein